MKRALASICVIAFAGFIFSTGVTLFEEGLQDLGFIGGGQTQSSIVAYR